MTITFKGEKMTLKKSVKRALLIAFAGLAFSTTVGFVVAASGVNQSDVSYEKVFIGNGSSAYGEIEKRNPNADVRDLVEFFEEENDIENAAYITEGFYYIPVVKGDK
jgi:hypothetical protein